MALSKDEKTYVYIGGGVAGAYVIYRLYKNYSAGSAGASGAVPAGAATSADYAALSGQEQADMAAMQSQNQDLLGQIQGLGTSITGLGTQETSDVQSLNSQFSTLTTTEQGDVQTLTSSQTSLAQSLADAVAALTAQIAAVPQTVAAGGAAAAPGANVPAVATGSTPTYPSQHPWTSGGFFSMPLGQVIDRYHNSEATARYLFSKGFRPGNLKGPRLQGSGYIYGSDVAGSVWHYVGPKGRNALPRSNYTVGAHG